MVNGQTTKQKKLSVWHLIEEMCLEVVVNRTHLLQRELGQLSPPPQKKNL